VSWTRNGRVEVRGGERLGRKGVRGLLTERAFRCIRELVEIDVEVDASAVGIGNADNLSLYAVAAGQAGHVRYSAGVAFGDDGVAELACGLAESEVRAGKHTEKERLHDR
jgi:hypothetical protein